MTLCGADFQGMKWITGFYHIDPDKKQHVLSSSIVFSLQVVFEGKKMYVFHLHLSKHSELTVVLWHD